MRLLRRLRIIGLGLLAGLALVAFFLPRLKPYLEEWRKRLTEALEAGKEAAREKERELESKISTEEKEEPPRYIV